MFIELMTLHLMANFFSEEIINKKKEVNSLSLVSKELAYLL